MLGGHVAAPLEAGALKEGVEPLLEVGELLNVEGQRACLRVNVSTANLPSAMEGGKRERTMSGHPAPAGNVGNGDAVADEEARGRRGQLLVQGAVQAARLVDVAVDTVLNLLRGVS